MNKNAYYESSMKSDPKDDLF